MIDNKYIQKAEDEFEYLTGDAAERRLAELREKAIRDEVAGLKSAERKGMEKGMEKGIKQTAKYNIPINVDTITRRYPINRTYQEGMKSLIVDT